MPNFLAEIGEGATKALSPIRARLPFGNSGTNSIQVSSTPVFFADGLVQHGWSGGQGATPDWDKLLGDPMHNAVVAAAVTTLCTAITQATLVLEKRVQNGQDVKWERQLDHEAITIFGAQEDLNESEIWEKTTQWKVTAGWAPWIVVYNQAGTKPVELVPWQPSRVRHFGDEKNLIARYEVQNEKGDWMPYSKREIIHFRHTLADNLRDGYTPLWAGKESIVGATAATTYTTALTLNSAVSSWLITQEKSEAQGANIETTPDDFQNFVDALRRKYTSNKRAVGGIDGINLPLKVTRMAWSPNEMSIDKLKAEYATEILSLIGVSRKLCDLGDDPTYLNLQEAIKDFWERRMKPECDKNADTLNRQLLPLFGLDKAQWRYRFDYSDVPGLQESQSELITRELGVYTAGGCDLFDLQTRINRTPLPEYKGLWAKPPQQLGEAPASGPDDSESEEAIKRFNPDQSRDDSGKWTSGGRQAGKGGRAVRSPMRAGTIEEAKVMGVQLSKNNVNIKLATDPASDVLATSQLQLEGGKLSAVKTVYSPAYEEKQRKAKFDRIAALHHDLPDLKKKMDAEIESGGKNAHQALALRLITKTGFRNGGEGGGGKVAAYGASSLRTQDARVEGDKIHFDFIGKEGVRQQHTVEDSALARHIEARQRDEHATVFDGDASKTLRYLDKISDGKYKVHDLRTHYASVLGEAVAQKIASAPDFETPKTEGELKVFKMRVARVVSRDLGHGPKAFDSKGVSIERPKIPKNRGEMALKNYIHPNVFAPFEKALKPRN